MRQYKVFEHPDGRIRYVKQGWSWPGFFFMCVWALSKRMWGIAVILFVSFFAIGFTFWFINSYFTGAYGRDIENATNALTIISEICLWILVGLNGNTWRERNLKSRGYEYKTILNVSNKEGAQALYIKEKQAQGKSDFLPPLSNSG